MKVVLFCGGQGMRIREVSDRVPKPMVRIGDRPILLHVMKYYAHFGHTEFILCLGYQGHVIKEYFLNYREALLNDFVLSDGGKSIDLLNSDIQDWRVTFVDTGLQSNVGQRLRAVRDLIGPDEMFLANYADGLTDLPLPELVENLHVSDKVATFICVRPSYSFHVVRLGEGDAVQDIEPLAGSDIWINGGFFAFRREIFDYIGPGEELVEEPFRRLIGEGKLLAHRYEGFWTAMDTFKDLQRLEGLWESGSRPWAVWQTPRIDCAGPAC
jgi:glucose-1-phosphate cytidylyltransferase